jgi:hypothetical protein
MPYGIKVQHADGRTEHQPLAANSDDEALTQMAAWVGALVPADATGFLYNDRMEDEVFVEHYYLTPSVHHSRLPIPWPK